tara:strand:+ start:897 stop:1361 length:465 start_codon:yes stop_codon:yes gene_type:complete
MKININNKSKINNPVEFISNDDPDFINSFEGEFDEALFNDLNLGFEIYLKHQKNNLQKLNNLLSDINLHFEYIWLIIFRNESGQTSTSFVIKTNTNEQGLTIFWRKYMSRAPGSGQNDLFLSKNEEFLNEGCVDKIKVQLTHYFRNPGSYLSSI